jgi:hypothetical protein
MRAPRLAYERAQRDTMANRDARTESLRHSDPAFAAAHDALQECANRLHDSGAPDAQVTRVCVARASFVDFWMYGASEPARVFPGLELDAPDNVIEQLLADGLIEEVKP